MLLAPVGVRFAEQQVMDLSLLVFPWYMLPPFLPVFYAAPVTKPVPLYISAYLFVLCAPFFIICFYQKQNIVDLIEVIIDGKLTPGRLSTVALVFEYLDHDLSGLLDTPEAANQITPALAKSYMLQLVEGVR